MPPSAEHVCGPRQPAGVAVSVRLLCFLTLFLASVAGRDVIGDIPSFAAPYPDPPDIVLKHKDGTDGCKVWNVNASLVVSTGQCIQRANLEHEGVVAVEQKGQRVPSGRAVWWPNGLAFVWLRENLKDPKNTVSYSVVERPLNNLGTEGEIVIKHKDGTDGCRGWIVNATLIVTAGECIERANKDHNGVTAVEMQGRRVAVSNTRWWKEGLAFCWLKESLKPASTSPPLNVFQTVTISDCGFASASARPFILHGENASVSEFPWHAGLYLTSEQVCGGSLVMPSVVMTAAHCMFKNNKLFDARDLQVSVGSPFRDWSHTTVATQHRNVSRLIPHPRFRGFARNFADDIGLVVLQSPIIFNAFVVPICVDWIGSLVPRPSENSVGKVVGWGRTNDSTPSPVLQSAQLPFIPFDKCAEAVPPTFLPFLTSDKFCAGKIGGATVAQGDSGGGLAFQYSGRWYLSGLVSVGIPGELTYSAFTAVHDHIAWLNQTINNIVDPKDFIIPCHEKKTIDFATVAAAQICITAALAKPL